MSARGQWLLLSAVLAFACGCGTILGFEDPTLEGGSGGASSGSSGQGTGGGGHAGDTQTSEGGTAGRAAAGGSGAAGMQAGGTSAGGEAGAGGASETGGTNGQAGTAGMGGGAGGSPGKGCGVGHLIISQVRTRGAAGAGDEFVELYNASSATVTLDPGWTLDARGSSGTSFSMRWTGPGNMIAPYGHFLIVGSAYTQTPSADSQLTSSGLTDAASVRLLHNNTVVDVLCFAYSATTTQALSDASYQCPGMPASNLPHNDSSTGNIDASIVRKTDGGTARCLDTGDNANDFVALAPAAPRDLLSPATP